MGVEDEDVVFDQLDTLKRGYVTAGQLQDLHQALYFTQVSLSHVEGAIRQVCGNKGVVSRQEFVHVLEEIDRRQTIQEHALWDFKALDCNGDHRITLKDALLLFQEFHAENFSLKFWQDFLDSRVEPDSDVCFDEICEWLCALPGGEQYSHPGQVDMWREQVERRQLEYMNHQYQSLAQFKEIDTDSLEEVRQGAKRKLNKWNKYGVHSILFDDGFGEEEDVKPYIKQRESVGTADLQDLIDLKYSNLQDKLLLVMANYSSDMDGEVSEIYQQLRRESCQLKGSNIEDKVSELSGCRAMLMDSIVGLMGEIGESLEKRYHDQESQFQQLKLEGKTSTTITDHIKGLYHNSLPGPDTCGEALVHLRERHQTEKSTILSRVNGVFSNMLVEYMTLFRQCLLLEEEGDFNSAAIAVGLAERSPAHACPGYNWDRKRSEILADKRLEERNGRRPVHSTGNVDEVDSGQGRLDLQCLVMSEMERKHFLEREALVYMLQGHDIQGAVSSAVKMTATEKKRRINALRNQHLSWRDSSLTGQVDGQSEVHQQLLQEGVALYWVGKHTSLQKKIANPTNNEIAVSVMADLQHAQGVEVEIKLQGLHKKTSRELAQLIKKERRSRVLEHFDNIAYVVLGAVDIGEGEKEYMDALQEKYQRFRDTVFLFSLKDQYGAEWIRFSEERKHKELLRVRKEDKALRGAGQHDEMQNIIGPKARTLPSLYSLIGDTKHFQHTTNTVIEDEVPAVNLLADLVFRYDMEQDRLLSWLKSPASHNQSAGSRRMELLRLHLETKCAELETDYEVALLGAGLLERVSKERKSDSDTSRQKQLAARRVQLRRDQLQQGMYMTNVLGKTEPPAGDVFLWREAYAREIYYRHYEERGRLLQLLQDDSLQELTEVAINMPRSERIERLAQLRVKQLQLDLYKTDDQDDYTDLLEEAAALQVVDRAEGCKKRVGKSVLPPNDQITCAVLISLQDLQDMEMATVLASLDNKTQEEVSQLWQSETKFREVGAIPNVFSVLTICEEEEEEDRSIIQMVDAKYSKLRDGLLVLAMSQQRESPRQLQGLKAKESALWDKGDAAGLSKLVQVTLTDGVVKLMGTNRGDYLSQISEKKNVGVCHWIEEMDEESKSHPSADLLTRFTKERTYITRRLQGLTYGGCVTPDDRKVLKARLYREIYLLTSMVETGRTFETAATAVGLAERQEEPHNWLKNDRDRYIKVASMIWGQRDEKQNSSNPVDVIQSTDPAQLQKSVVRLLQRYHDEEVHVFLSLLTYTEQESQLTASLSTQQQRSDSLGALYKQYNILSADDVKQKLRILQQAVVISRECRRSKLPQDCQSEDNVCPSLLADLLQQHNQDAERYLNVISPMTPAELQQLQTKLKQMGNGGWFDNIAVVLFASEEQCVLTDEDLIQAVEEKYDALNDKLLIEALISELGEVNWLRLSEQERQRWLMELKLKQRQLRKQGLLDEAAALLGNLEKDKESLGRLMGNSRQEQERRMKERMERRRQRLAEGRTEAECDEMEQDDLEREEENKRKENILLQMEHKIEEEKAALLKQLMESGDDLEKERERQRNIARLKMEQRRVRQEDKFDSAALMLGLAEEHGEKIKSKQEEERVRQERLARERLEGAKRRREAGQTSVPLCVDVDVDSVRDSDLMLVLMEVMDKKHQAERAVLIQCQMSDDSKTVHNMETPDLQERLKQLADFRDGWRKSHNKTPQQQLAIFQEAVSCILELQRRESESGTSPDCQMVGLLADLQQLQGKDMTQVLTRLQNQDVTEFREEIRQVVLAVTEGWHDNVASVLGLTEAKERDAQEELLQELDHKYDALRDKLIIEALIKQYGQVQWSHMTEQERQKHLLQTRLEERRLHRAGQIDEINLVLGKYLQDKSDLEKLLSESRDVQHRRMQLEKERRRQLHKEREASGMPADEATLTTILEEEEASSQQMSVLDTLEVQYEEERAALIAQLTAQKDQFSKDRERQAALARLRRDQKQLQKEENLESACLIFSIGQQAIGNRERSFVSDRDRQQQLAQERLNVLKKRRNRTSDEHDEVSLVTQLEKPSHETDLPVEESLLEDMDERHADERDVLVQLLQAAAADTSTRKTAQKHNAVQDLKKELAKLHQEHSKWMTRCRQTVLAGEEVSPVHTAKRRTRQFELLKQALVYRLEVESRLSGRQSDEQLGVQILTDLQQKQTDDTRLITSLITQKDREFLQKMCQMQTLSRREGWYDNLTSALFLVSEDSQYDQAEPLEHGPDLSEVQKQLEEEFERERKELQEKALCEGQDVDALLVQMEAEQEQRRKVILDQHERQRQDLQHKLEMRKLASMDREFEAATAVQLIKMSGSQYQAVSDKVQSERSRQGNLLQEKLAARRQARKRRVGSESDVLVSTTVSPPPLIPAQMRREKSGLGSDVSEDDKQALTSRLIREQENLQKKRTEEQERQDQMVKRRLEQKRGKLKNEAAELYSLGERQKTILEQSQKEERDRQLSIIVERKNRVMYERTKTQRSTSSPDPSGFEGIVKGPHLSKDEKMELAAKQLQDKFQKEASASAEPSGGLLDDKARFEQLKARKQQRKKKGEESTD